MVESMEFHSPHRMMNAKKRGDGIFVENFRFANTCTLCHVRGMYSTFLPIGTAPFVLNPVQIFRKKFIFNFSVVFQSFLCLYVFTSVPDP